MRKDQQLLIIRDLEFIPHTPQSFHAFYSVAFPSRTTQSIVLMDPAVMVCEMTFSLGRLEGTMFGTS